jgi:hypothetical protein
MGQVIFWRARRGVRRRDAKHRASAVAVSTDAGVICAGQQGAARTHARKSSQDTGCRPIRHCHKLGKVRCPESPACNAVPGRCTRHVTLRKSDFRRLVTLTLQRRNAKNNFAERTLRTSVVSSHSTCNVAQSATKFHKNPAVSDAVETLIDCMMLNKNYTVDSLYRPVGTRIVARATPHDLGAWWQRNEDGGAS